MVIVVQTAQDRVRDDLSTPRQPISSVWLTRYALLNALVWAGLIKVLLTLFHHPMQMSLAQNASPFCIATGMGSACLSRSVSWTGLGRGLLRRRAGWRGAAHGAGEVEGVHCFQRACQ